MYKFIIIFLIPIMMFVNQIEAYQGSIKNMVYRPPSSFGHLFAIPIDKLGLGVGYKITTEIASDQMCGEVKFRDDFGTLIGLTYEKLPPEFIHESEEKLFKYATEGWMNKFRQISNIQCIDNQTIYLSNQRVHRVIVRFPQGSNLLDMSLNQRLDATRGILIFKKRNWIFTLAVLNLDMDKKAEDSVKQALDAIFSVIQIN